VARVDWPRWAPVYQSLLADFAFDPREDERARDELDALLADRLPASLDALRAALEGREAWVVGAAATPADLQAIPPGAPVLVADGAAQVALPLVRPLAVVTDLDGDVGVQVAANAAGVPLVVHAHGDNRPALREHVPRMTGPVLGTTQAEPRGRARNFGGFTDGDRACCLAVHLGAERLALVGFDFGRPAAKPGRDPETKRRKLAWAKRIVEGLGVPVRRVAPR
jgi:uncharacterized Rossmann fold enzyme